MNVEYAQLIVYAVSGIGLFVWMAGVLFILRSARACKAPPADRLELGEPDAADCLAGSAEVDGDPADLANRAAAAIALGKVAAVGQMRIVERTSDRVVFEGAGPGMGMSVLGQYVRRGELKFNYGAPNLTRIEYRVSFRAGRGLLWGGAAFLVAGLIAVAAGFFFIGQFVAVHPNPAIRGQALQICQTVHFLWPPFLFGTLYRRRQGMLRNELEMFVHNLPYYKEK